MLTILKQQIWVSVKEKRKKKHISFKLMWNVYLFSDFPPVGIPSSDKSPIYTFWGPQKSKVHPWPNDCVLFSRYSCPFINKDSSELKYSQSCEIERDSGAFYWKLQQETHLSFFIYIITRVRGLWQAEEKCYLLRTAVWDRLHNSYNWWSLCSLKWF